MRFRKKDSTFALFIVFLVVSLCIAMDVRNAYSQSCFCTEQTQVPQDFCTFDTPSGTWICASTFIHDSVACCDQPGSTCNYEIAPTGGLEIELSGTCTNPFVEDCDGCEFTWSVTWFGNCAEGGIIDDSKTVMVYRCTN